MTNETLTFIELDDLIGLRFECGNCHEKTAVRLSSTSKMIDYVHGFKCPHCQESWFQGDQDLRLKTVARFIAALKELKDTEMPLGLTLEITSPRIEAT